MSKLRRLDFFCGVQFRRREIPSMADRFVVFHSDSAHQALEATPKNPAKGAGSSSSDMLKNRERAGSPWRPPKRPRSWLSIPPRTSSAGAQN